MFRIVTEDCQCYGAKPQLLSADGIGVFPTSDTIYSIESTFCESGMDFGELDAFCLFEFHFHTNMVSTVVQDVQ